MKKNKKPQLTKSFVISATILICVLSALAVSYLYSQKILNEDRTEQLNQHAQLQAKLLSQNIEKYLSLLDADIRFYIEREYVAEGLASASIDKQKLITKQVIDKTSSHVKNVIAVRYFPAGTAKVDRSLEPPMRFSDVDMIRNAEKGDAVKPEAHKHNKKWLMTYVIPVLFQSKVKDGTGVLGVFMVVADIENLRLDLAKNEHGLVVLTQSFDNSKPVVILSAGHGDLADKKSAKVNGSYWTLTYTSSEQALAHVYIDRSQASIILAVSAVMSALIGYFVGKILASFLVKTPFPKVRVKSPSSNASSNSNAEDADTFSNSIYQAASILDVELNPDDEALLPLGDAEHSSKQNAVGVSSENASANVDEDILNIEDARSQEIAKVVPDSIFRAYDIRGIALEQIGKELTQRIGQALGSEALDNRESTLIVARDARNHSPQIMEWLIRGILSSGCDVLNIGTVPTPLMYFATETLDESRSGVIVTASHNPGEYNGFKVVMNGKIRSADDIKALRHRILKEDAHEGIGKEHHKDIIPSYIDTIFSDVALAGEITVVVDAANAVPGIVAPQLFEELGCQVVSLYCDLDGSFPNHDPDPSRKKNLQSLIDMVQDTSADIGIAFDGDGDRLAVVTPKGAVISPDQLLLLFAKDIVSRNPGADVIFDVKSSRLLNSCVTSYGGRPIMWKTGHSPMKEKMLETGALLGGEYSGHIFIKDRWFGFDDGMYAAARLLEILTLSGESIDDLMAEFKMPLSTPEIRVAVDEDKKFEIVDQLVAKGDFVDGKKNTLDGIRVDYEKGWGLVRASNTSADLTLRFEADDEDTLHQIKSLFAREIKKIDKSLVINWDQD